MYAKFLKLILFSFFIVVFSCGETGNHDIIALNNFNDSLKTVYAPDKRVARFHIEIKEKEGDILLQGESDQPVAVDILIDRAEKLGFNIINKINVLPDSTVGQFQYAVVNNSVANIRSNPKHSGELATQALLGTDLKVLKIDGDFYQVQTPDGYISWVDHGGVKLLTREQFEAWKSTDKIIFTKTYGSVYKNQLSEFEKVGDIVLGSQLAVLEESERSFKVQYPDKRTGYVKKSECLQFNTWIKDVQPSGNLLELYARELMGVPYLWGGTSSKGVDCSGFTKTVYLMNGYIIPRDASQQIMAGNNVDPELDMSNLQKGDLMFFGKKATDSTKQRVTHVGIWLGNGKGEFIHASGKVKIGSIDSEAENYDAFNTNRYLGSRRYLGEEDPLIIDLKKEGELSKLKS
ncbi:C40 family peptidase [Lutimonas zeaxanthinifaciens]|uniref:C40 family peptidase n=1 Tax=Lutimonas zeaxanthinifaciens TaxID=3060215 RepID=UPI00265CF222|nr:C40 family peptidase [Lutimonas sp. YSD2104]WKK64840.1 C40 family peptidase [Lutimonas sp. YSD2104]